MWSSRSLCSFAGLYVVSDGCVRQFGSVERRLVAWGCVWYHMVVWGSVVASGLFGRVGLCVVSYGSVG